MKNNIIAEELSTLGIIDANAISTYYPEVRDRNDVSALICKKSGVIFLSDVQQVEKRYYNEKEGTSYWNKAGRKEALKETWEDDYRRFNDFLYLISGKEYLDVGSGLGGILDLFGPHAQSISAVEPQDEIREELKSIGYSVYPSITDVTTTKLKFDTISLFHVFEHINTPLASLKELHSCLKEKGKIIIEVPHANDALLKSFDLEAFKKFTLWSEHLILHTRESLKIYLQAAGFKNINIQGFQRYPLANHLNWLLNKEAGGHQKLYQFRNKELEEAYANHLNRIDQTDTLIAIAEK